MDRKNWPWRKKISYNANTISTSPALHAAFETPHFNSVSASPASTSSPSFEARSDKPGMSVPAEKTRPLLHFENGNALDTVVLKEQVEQKVISLTEKLEDAERDLVRKEAMVKQHSEVAEEAILGWEKSGVEVVSLKQELAASMQQREVAEGRILELEEGLKGCMTQLRQAQGEQQQRTQEALEEKMQEWSKVRAEMEAAEKELNQRMLAAEARSSAMAKSLEERARAIVKWQGGKEKAEMEAGLLQVKCESQSAEMAAMKYELQVLSKELEIRNQENECCRKAEDSAHKQHLEDVKKITKLDSECQRLRMIVRKRLPGPAAIAQMKMEVEKSEQSKRRQALDAAKSHAQISSHQGANKRENGTSSKDMADKVLSMEEETKTLKETLAKKTAELQSARQMCARTANKLSVAEEQLESLQETPTSVRSMQTCALESFLRSSQDVDAGKSEKLDDEVSCAESWASALVLELSHIKKAKQSMDLSSVTSIMPDSLFEAPPLEPLVDTCGTLKQAPPTDNSSSAQDYVTLKTLASKEAQLQSANLMCKDSMAKLASVEVKLGGTWMSENPKANVEGSANSVGEALGILAKLDQILDDMRIAVASVGDTTDDDNSDHGLSSPLIDGLPKSASADEPSSNMASLEEQVGMQAKEISEKKMQVDTLEAARADLQMQLHAAEEELSLIKPELERARMHVEDLEASALKLQNVQRQVLVDEETKRGKLEAQLETEQTKVSKLESSIASLTIELADQRKEHKETAAKCDTLELKLQSYVGREHSMPAVCRFEGEVDARARKEREVAVAKEKLLECQRTILVLGKQLTAFSTPSSASFDCSAMPLHYEPLDASQDQDSDHAHKVLACDLQRRPFSYNSVNPHDGSARVPANRITHGSDSATPAQLNASHYSKPRRIQSDLSYRTGMTNHGLGRLQYSVAEHLLMDDGVSSFYDSLPESPGSSPSSQYTPPSDKFRTEGHKIVQAGGGGVRMSLAKSLESAATRAAVDDNDKRVTGRRGIKTNVAVVAGGSAKTGGMVKTGGGVGGGGGAGGGKGNKGFSRFFGRSKK